MIGNIQVSLSREELSYLINKLPQGSLRTKLKHERDVLDLTNRRFNDAQQAKPKC